MPQSIVQIQDYQGNLHDLDNRYITLSAASGTLSADDLSVLQASSKNYIIYSDKIYKLTSSNGSALQYSREDAINNTHETITVTVSSGTFEYSVIDIVSSSTVEDITNQAVTSENKIATMADITAAIGDAMDGSY